MQVYIVLQEESVTSIWSTLIHNYIIFHHIQSACLILRNLLLIESTDWNCSITTSVHSVYGRSSCRKCHQTVTISAHPSWAAFIFGWCKFRIFQPLQRTSVVYSSTSQTGGFGHQGANMGPRWRRWISFENSVQWLMQPDLMQGASCLNWSFTQVVQPQPVKRQTIKIAICIYFIKLQEWVPISHVGVCGHL